MCNILVQRVLRIDLQYELFLRVRNLFDSSFIIFFFLFHHFLKLLLVQNILRESRQIPPEDFVDSIIQTVLQLALQNLLSLLLWISFPYKFQYYLTFDSKNDNTMVRDKTESGLRIKNGGDWKWKKEVYMRRLIRVRLWWFGYRSLGTELYSVLWLECPFRGIQGGLYRREIVCRGLFSLLLRNFCPWARCKWGSEDLLISWSGCICTYDKLAMWEVQKGVTSVATVYYCMCKVEIAIANSTYDYIINKAAFEVDLEVCYG